MAGYKLPNDLTADASVTLEQLRSFETLIFSSLREVKTQIEEEAAELDDAFLQQVRDMTSDLNAVRAEMANRAEKAEKEQLAEQVLADANALLADAESETSETQLSETAEEGNEEDEEGENLSNVSEDDTTVTDPTTESEEAPQEKETALTQEGEEAPATEDEEVLTTEADEDAPEEKLSQAELLNLLLSLAADGKLEIEDQTTDDDETTLTDGVAEEEVSSDDGTSTELDTDTASAADDTQEVETPQEEEVLNTDSTHNSTTQNDDPAKEGENMEQTLQSQVQATEGDTIGNATLQVAYAGRSYAEHALGGVKVNDLGDVTKVFQTAYENLGGRSGWNQAPHTGRDFVKLISVRPDKEDFATSGSTVDLNSQALETATDDFLSTKSDQMAPMVASGGICAPCPTDFTIRRVAVAMAPIESALPVVRVTGGCFSYTKRVNWTQVAREGIARITPHDDFLGYVDTPVSAGGPGPTPNKPCVTIPCPDSSAKCCIAAVWWCMRVGNFQMITWPALVEAFLQDMLVAFASEKEQSYLTQIDQASVTQWSAGKGYNLRSNISWIIRTAIINRRKSMHLPIDSGPQVDMLVPDWLVEAIKQDYSNSTDGLDTLSTGEVDRWLRSLGPINPIYHYDGLACADPADMMADCKEDGGEVAEFPGQAAIYFWDTGDVVRLFQGNLELGMVRDSILNGTNDVMFAAEEFTSLCVREAPCKIAFPVCPSGALPPRAEAPVCGHTIETKFEVPEAYGNIPPCDDTAAFNPDGGPCNDASNYPSLDCEGDDGDGGAKAGISQEATLG